MRGGSPRLWPYTPANSPQALPEHAIVFTQNEVYPITEYPQMDSTQALDGKALVDTLGQYSGQAGSIDKILGEAGAPLLGQRRPFLLIGELANPYRLQDISIGALPIFPVRLEGVCRTWADSLDNRDMNPGVHHVTLASSPGWWELTFLAMATIDQMKAMVEWLGNGVRSAWKPVKLAEGAIRLESDVALEAPSMDDISWDGQVERVERDAPSPTGPTLDLSTIMIPVHTRQGCYDHRGRIARCTHFPHRTFHEDLFRRGSANQWNSVLKTL